MILINAYKAVNNILNGDGRKKHGDRWMKMNKNVYCLKAIKHILVYMIAGVAKDKDSGEHTLAHAMCRCGLVIEKDVLDGG